MAPQPMVQLGYPPTRINLLISIDGTLLPVISIDDLIGKGLATGRVKGLVGVESLRTPDHE
jgi:hypothetical protein